VRSTNRAASDAPTQGYCYQPGTHKKARHRRAFVINYPFSIINYYSTVTDFAKFLG